MWVKDRLPFTGLRPYTHRADKGECSMRILVVGGSGLIGYHLLPRLCGAGHEVVSVTRGERPLADDRVQHVRADRHDLAALATGLGGAFDAVIDNVAYQPDDALSLLGLLEGRVGRYVLTSTAFVYNGLEEALTSPHRPFREDDPHVPSADGETRPGDAHASYVVGKQRLEEALTGVTDIPLTIVRPLLQIVGENTNDGRFEWFWRRVAGGGPIWLPDDAREKAGPCQLSYSGDVAAVLAAVATSDEPLTGAFNVGQPELWTYEEYVRLMGGVAGREVRIRYAPRSELDALVGGTYHIPLPYPVAFDVSRSLALTNDAPTPMRTWIEAVATWFDHHLPVVTPSWYAARALELGKER